MMTSVACYVCTYKRNYELVRLLDSLEKADKLSDARLAVVVVDDNPDGSAQAVVETASVGFSGGLHYKYSGAQNISVARNMGLEAGIDLGAEWVAMVDDDQVVVEHWLKALLETLDRFKCDGATGPVHWQYPPEAPKWLRSQPFSTITEAETVPDGAQVKVCSTGNSIISRRFLQENPHIRFQPDLGDLGGEDMVFYAAATAAGLRARYSQSAVCFEVEPMTRCEYRYIVRRCLWMGNTEAITNLRSKSSGRARLTARSGRRAVKYIRRSIGRLLRGDSPQIRYTVGGLAQCAGILIGVANIGLRHPS